MDLNTREIIRAINNVAKGGGNGNNNSLGINLFTINDKPYGVVLCGFVDSKFVIYTNKVYTLEEFFGLTHENFVLLSDNGNNSFYFIYENIQDLTKSNYGVSRFDGGYEFVFEEVLIDQGNSEYVEIQLDKEYYIISESLNAQIVYQEYEEISDDTE